MDCSLRNWANQRLTRAQTWLSAGLRTRKAASPSYRAQLGAGGYCLQLLRDKSANRSVPSARRFGELATHEVVPNNGKDAPQLLGVPLCKTNPPTPADCGQLA